MLSVAELPEQLKNDSRDLFLSKERPIDQPINQIAQATPFNGKTNQRQIHKQVR